MIWIMSLLNVKNMFIQEGDIWRSVSGEVIIRNNEIWVKGIVIKFPNSSLPKIIGLNPVGSKIHYFGPERTIHFTGYGSVKLKDLYPGIDFILNGLSDNKLEFYFYVRKGYDPRKIKMSVEGGYLKEDDGCIKIYRDHKEVFTIKDFRAYQGSEEIGIKAKIEDNRISFILRGYDKNRSLVIDPTFILSSGSFDWVYDVFIDDSGYVYATGYTLDPSTFIPPNNVFGNPTDTALSAFAVKLSPDMDSVISVAIIAGSRHDIGTKIRKDPFGNVIIIGYTNSLDFAPSRTVYGTTSSLFVDAFITKLSSNLDSHIRTVILASSDDDYAVDIISDSVGNAYVLGVTYRYYDFGLSKTLLGGGCGYGDIFITKLDFSLNYITSTLICGSNEDVAKDFIKANNSFYIVATTYSSYDLPRDTTFGSLADRDIYAVRVNLSLDSIINGVIFADTGFDYSNNIISDDSGYIYIAGYVQNALSFGGGLPRNIIGTPGGDYDIVIIKTTPDLRSVLAMTFIASPGGDILTFGKVMKLKGDTLFIGATTGDVSIGGSYCPRCDVAPGDTARDAVVIGLSKDLSTCIGASTITGDGRDRANILLYKGDTLIVGGGFVNSVDTSSYPQPYVRLGIYGDYHEGFIIKVSPGCLVGVNENIKRVKEVKPFSFNGSEITINLSKPSYVGFDIYTYSGRKVFTKSAGYLLPGEYRYPMNLPRGVYILRLRIGDKVYKSKLIIR